MSDLITLTGIEATGHHGVFEIEKREGQTFRVDLTLETDHSAAGASDALEETVNYAELAEAAHALIVGEPRDLIEALAEDIAARCLGLAGERATAVTVTVHKPQAPIEVPFGGVSVTVRRERLRMVLALGSNLGDSGATLAEAVGALAAHPRVRVDSVSDVARTKPVGGPEGQPDYLNIVVTGETSLAPRALLAFAHRIEAEHHRERGVRWGARTLDIDVVALRRTGTAVGAAAGGELVSADPVLTLPHPRAAERAFVLAPWSWAEPEARLAGQGVAELAASAPDRDGVERLGPLKWEAAAPNAPAEGPGR
ncbi:2-amino-4-hydroxy-6-hydroxymethyldihydropteridine diphosphokinase [Falsarthrobacter nasiphocae]|uniref:Bifunctional folate synthesis protein n=1 Tax=Falsarthrobacter nasiphocae TaxID=189863 RepID=A0AAE4C6Z6_9MICC|nr:2-amino-4-hydroxy-6-hydroxymethyldihydropteridine diphosphokinase [Falsarthrobacter nasiphocae]MDR6891984.1 dihydroneopterin aldolase/2-amino-4-hydroxy-6-hydroxymethyldihydropteridine diphosphokinase [Falsarthrobacter nasiphocae]